MAVSAARAEYIFKILVIGEVGCGKTSIIKQYVHKFFSNQYKATIEQKYCLFNPPTIDVIEPVLRGVDFALKIVQLDSDTIVRLQLWDIAGQERFGSMTRVYYRDAAAAFIVFDLTRSATFEAVMKWKKDLDEKVITSDGKPVPAFLLANKCDLPREPDLPSDEVIDKFCEDNKFAGWAEVSAKEGKNIEEAATLLLKLLGINANYHL